MVPGLPYSFGRSTSKAAGRTQQQVGRQRDQDHEGRHQAEAPSRRETSQQQDGETGGQDQAGEDDRPPRLIHRQRDGVRQLHAAANKSAKPNEEVASVVHHQAKSDGGDHDCSRVQTDSPSPATEPARSACLADPRIGLAPSSGRLLGRRLTTCAPRPASRLSLRSFLGASGTHDCSHDPTFGFAWLTLPTRFTRRRRTAFRILPKKSAPRLDSAGRVSHSWKRGA